MSYVKIAVIGAGSFVFGPSMLDQALRQHRLSPVELALVDPDGIVVELMAGVGRRMARESGVDAKITAHTRRDSALDGADFVICSAAREMWRRFAIDCKIIERLAPGHMVSEFGGIQGISYSLRQIALIEEICADMRRLCPKAWLLNAANPLPRVTQAAHERGIQTAGFCSVSTAVYGSLWRIFGGGTLSFPYTPAQERWKAELGGVNHFTWLVGLQERMRWSHYENGWTAEPLQGIPIASRSPGRPAGC
jgi:alpha-galactosidase/6-phospho-beta-glucosidase family protein